MLAHACGVMNYQKQNCHASKQLRHSYFKLAVKPDVMTTSIPELSTCSTYRESVDSISKRWEQFGGVVKVLGSQSYLWV